jgi:hypothetical protein
MSRARGAALAAVRLRDRKLVDGSLYRTRPFGTGFGYFGEIQEYTYSWQTNAAWTARAARSCTASRTA